MIQTLKDIKDALANVPDEMLERLSFGIGEDAYEEIGLVATCDDGAGEYNYPQIFDVINQKYPQLLAVEKLVQNAIKAQKELDDDDGTFADTLAEEPLSSETFKSDVIE